MANFQLGFVARLRTFTVLFHSVSFLVDLRLHLNHHRNYSQVCRTVDYGSLSLQACCQLTLFKIKAGLQLVKNLCRYCLPVTRFSIQFPPKVLFTIAHNLTFQRTSFKRFQSTSSFFCKICLLVKNMIIHIVVIIHYELYII